MTLDTRVYVHDQADPVEVFRLCQSLLTEFDEDHRPPERQLWKDTQDKTWHEGAWTVRPDSPRTMSNNCGQGLPAWLMLHYRPGAALRPDPDACDPTYCDAPTPDEPEPYHYHKPVSWLEISLDTAYGYEHNGMGCGDLHAGLVGRLGSWLDERGIRWSWKNEFTGDIHGGPDRYERLIDLASGGFEASAWFSATVLPAIAAHGAGSSK